jgi:hypothetical protein
MVANGRERHIGSVQCDSINGIVSDNRMKLSAKGFLRVVGFMYVTLGTGGLAALLLPSMGLLYLCGFSAVFLLVTPPGFALEYGIQASCFGPPRACNLDADVIQHARAVLRLLCVISVVGGLSGIWADIYKRQASRPCGVACTSCDLPWRRLVELDRVAL